MLSQVLVASVSNWGGHALCCALALLAWDSGATSTAIDSLGTAANEPTEFTRLVVPGVAAARAVLLAANEADIVDGINGAAGGSVDGMPLEQQLQVLEKLLAVTHEAMRASPRGGDNS